MKTILTIIALEVAFLVAGAWIIEKVVEWATPVKSQTYIYGGN